MPLHQERMTNDNLEEIKAYLLDIIAFEIV